MFSNAAFMVREYIAANPDEWNEIISAAEFQKYFTVKGTALKNVHAGFDKEHPQARYLKYNSWYLEYYMADGDVCGGEGFLRKSLEVFKAMKPFNDYLNCALKDFTMPTR